MREQKLEPRGDTTSQFANCRKYININGVEIDMNSQQPKPCMQTYTDKDLYQQGGIVPGRVHQPKRTADDPNDRHDIFIS